MKTLLSFILLFIVSCSQINAQALYPLFKKAHQWVNQYNYNSDDITVSIDVPKKNQKFYKMDLKIISDALLKADFKYDNKNDTILIAGTYESPLIGVGPDNLFAQSSKGTTQMVRYFLEGWDFEYKEQEEYYGGNDDEYYPLMYSGDVDSLRKIFSDKGGHTGGYDEVLRIVIKDGKVVPPTLMWTY